MLTSHFTDVLPAIRCQRVCKLWREFLPGRDPVLLEKLFLKARFVDEATQKRINEGNGRDFTPVPFILVLLKLTLKPITPSDRLPYLAYSIEVLDGDLEETWNYRRLVDFNGKTNFHPIIKNPVRYMNLVNPNFTSPAHEGNAYLNFRTIEELVTQTCMPKDYDYKDGSWKDMLICQPAVEGVDVVIRWSRRTAYQLYHVRKDDGDGVTVGDFVESFREKLSDAKADLMSFSHELTLSPSDECDYHFDSDLWGWND